MKYLPLNVLKLHRMLKQTLFQPTVADWPEHIDFIVIRLPLWYKFTSFFSVSSLKRNYSCKTTEKKKKKPRQKICLMAERPSHALREAV